MNNNEEFKRFAKQKNIISILTMIIFLLIAAIISVMISKKGDSTPKTTKTEQTETNNKKGTEKKQEDTTPNQVTPNDTKKDETKKEDSVATKEVEVKNPENYKYLIDRLNFLPSDCVCGEIPIVDEVDSNSIVNTALYNLSDQQEKITIDKNNELFNELNKKYGSSNNQLQAYKISDNELTFRTIKIDKVKNKISEMFGKNYSYKFESFYGKEKSNDSDYKCSVVYYEYVEKLNAYLLVEGSSCGVGPKTHTSTISKVTTQDNNINIYIMFTKNGAKIEYKYTFTKSGNSYQFTNLEKIK